MSATEWAEFYAAGIHITRACLTANILPTGAALFLQPFSLPTLLLPTFWHLPSLFVMAGGELAGSNVSWEVIFSCYHHEVPKGPNLPIPPLSCSKPDFCVTWYSLPLRDIKRYVAKGLTQQIDVHQLAELHRQGKNTEEIWNCQKSLVLLFSR